jgi:4-hydroxy-tetrahydrodipicolinate reductase
VKKKILKVGVSGAAGRMGRLTIKAVDAAEGLEIGGLYAPGRQDQMLDGHRASADPSALKDCDVVIELTHPGASDLNVPVWRNLGADVVIGTSGYDTARIELLRHLWGDIETRCLVVPNFSIGAVLMIRFAEMAATYFESSEIVEMHHFDKPDAPSGTSLQTATKVAAARSQAVHSRGEELAPGALGASVEGIPIHSLRVHGALAHQEIIFGTTGQFLTIRHDTTSYEAFSQGVLLSLRQVHQLPSGVTVGIDGLLRVG